MGGFVRNTRDFSAVDDRNPTRLLSEASAELQLITDFDLLVGELKRVVAGSSISKRNHVKFLRSVEGLVDTEDCLFFIFNFILAGSAMQVKF